MSTAAASLQKVADLLGGDTTLSRSVSGPLDAHRLLLDGLPAPAFNHLASRLTVIGKTELIEKAVGMSLRTFQRSKEAGDKALNAEHSGRAWKFAEILARATDVFGSQADAETWLDRPAMGLDQNRPIDLLATPAGVELVEEHLTRLEYGVYA